MQKSLTIRYQPGYAYFITTWSWIGFIYLLALIIQLELINLNWQSMTIALIAVILTIINILGYQVTITSEAIHLKRPVFKRHRTIEREKLTQIAVQKHGLLITTTELDYQPEQLLLRPKDKQQLVATLKAAGWPIVE
ncbi:EbsA family protein [Latilactobacillus fuchuensis]|uniref:EbsA family protein n=1 Tax=Latilactobacillus fuchuensis TaxID=164393 RepID=UPI0039B00D4D